MDFSEALIKLKEGKYLYRKGWNGVEAGITMYVFLKDGVQIKHSYPSVIALNKQEYSLMDMDPFFVFYHENKGTYNMWVPSMWDIMAIDWDEWATVYEIDPEISHDSQSFNSMVDEDLTSKGKIRDLQ